REMAAIGEEDIRLCEDGYKISPSLFHGSVRPTTVPLPSTSLAHGNVAAASAAATAVLFLCQPSHCLPQPLPDVPTASALPLAFGTSSSSSIKSSPAAAVLDKIQHQINADLPGIVRPLLLLLPPNPVATSAVAIQPCPPLLL
ncbi:hypothetical protein BHE74_00011062, partial [Ensete ventricosum]